jgi:hypothetical protein
LRGSLISILLGDWGVITKASPKSALQKKQTQIAKRVDRDTRCAAGHSSTDTGVDYPVWQYRYNARCYFDMDNPAARTFVRCDAPAIVDHKAGANDSEPQLPARYGQNGCVMALGRKNWLHGGSPQSGPNVAAILSAVESCRRLGVRF